MVLAYVNDFLFFVSLVPKNLQVRGRLDKVLDRLGQLHHPDKGVWDPAMAYGLEAATCLTCVVCAICRHPTSNQISLVTRERPYHRRFAPGQYKRIQGGFEIAHTLPIKSVTVGTWPFA
jgi:hypothetical protein